MTEEMKVPAAEVADVNGNALPADTEGVSAPNLPEGQPERHELSTAERFVLFATRRSDFPVREIILWELTGLPFTVVVNALGALASLGLVRPIEDGTFKSYVAVPLFEKPCVSDCEAWLAHFCEEYPQFIEFDKLATTCASFGIVVLCAVLSGAKDEHFIAQLTSLPIGFVALVIELMDDGQHWWSEDLFELRRLLHSEGAESLNVQHCHEAMMGQFWEIHWTPELQRDLEILREGHQIGNKVDDWADEQDCNFEPVSVN